MSAERDELMRMVQSISDDQVSRLLAEMRERDAGSTRSGPSGWYRDMIDEPSYWS
jgi:hypothetical protein